MKIREIIVKIGSQNNVNLMRNARNPNFREIWTKIIKHFDEILLKIISENGAVQNTAHLVDLENAEK